MSGVLGLDTSNYTTSAAWYRDGEIVQQKRPLPVREGALGLRQSDAVFHHVQGLPQVLETLFEGGSGTPSAVGVSTRPRDVEGSYMPCFTVGHSAARQLCAVFRIPMYAFSHQCGHVMAALYSARQLGLRHAPFLAFHVSGGTTEALYVEPDREKGIKAACVGQTLDLNAGQVIDRIGALMGLPFPAGPALEELAKNAQTRFQVKPSVKGTDCCLSGLENQCKTMLAGGTSENDVACYCLDFILETLTRMTKAVQKEYGKLPLVYSGGVMSNALLNAALSERFGAYFAEPAFSADNAAGIAVLTAMQAGEREGF